MRDVNFDERVFETLVKRRREVKKTAQPVLAAQNLRGLGMIVEAGFHDHERNDARHEDWNGEPEVSPHDQSINRAELAGVKKAEA